MPSRWSISCLGILFGASNGCTAWTSLQAGYGLSSERDRSVAGVEVRRALGGSLYSGYGLIGARVDGSSDQSDLEIHAGVMRPLRISDRFGFVPSATLELARASKIDGNWYGGALGPALATELVFWGSVRRRSYTTGPLLGCMGGAPGIDCPSSCRAGDVVRDGFGLRASIERDFRLGSDYPDQNDWMLWLTFGVTRASTARERECCSVEPRGFFERAPHGECR